MACLDMYNNSNHKCHHQMMSPSRISFSNDFVDVQQAMKQQQESRSSRSDTPSTAVSSSSDFEFSTTNYSKSMMSADEIFSKGRLLPYKDDNNSNKIQRTTTTTLKEELLVNDDGYEDFSLKPPKGIRWKGLLGLKKSHIGSKKVDKSEGSQVKGAQLNITSQELLDE